MSYLVPKYKTGCTVPCLVFGEGHDDVGVPLVPEERLREGVAGTNPVLVQVWDSFIVLLRITLF